MNGRGLLPELHDNLLRAALRHAELGYAVFPCVPGRKVPATEHGLHDATTDRAQIERWWAEQPTANVAIRTNSLLVVDIDGSDNPWLTDDLKKLEALNLAPTAQTPRGGRHHFFRQPDGCAWRNTAGRFAPNVDTRADGGYVIVAPSRIDGKSYRWVKGRELDVPPDKLPKPPQWLIDLIDELAAPATSQAQNNPSIVEADCKQIGTVISAGRRNETLARLAGAMRRVGMTRSELAAALHQVNADRCRPSLEAGEVEHIAASVSRYAPNEAAAGQGFRNPDYEPIPALVPLSAGELIAANPSLRPQVISGLLRCGETMNVIAPPKTGKSWLVLGLAICVATGRQWLGTFATTAGDVLIIDNELHPETLADRIPRVAASLQVDFSRISNSLFFHTSRGKLRDIYSLGRSVELIESGRFVLIVLDAFYRFLPRDTDENSNAALAEIYNHIDALADRLACSIVLIHHATKGNQSAKAVTDVGAGAGSQSRATDTHLILRPHQQSSVVVLEAAVRSWPPVAPVALRWSFPLWIPAPDLDPLALKAVKTPRRKDTSKPEKPMAPDWTVERFVEEFVTENPSSRAQIREATKDVPDLSIRRVADLLEIAESQGLIRTQRSGRGGQLHYSLVVMKEQVP